jgi:hypothetical protein
MENSGRDMARAEFVATGLCDNFSAGIRIAKDSKNLDKAREKLDKLIELTRQCKQFIRDEPIAA